MFSIFVSSFFLQNPFYSMIEWLEYPANFNTNFNKFCNKINKKHLNDQKLHSFFFNYAWKVLLWNMMVMWICSSLQKINGTTTIKTFLCDSIVVWYRYLLLLLLLTFYGMTIRRQRNVKSKTFWQKLTQLFCFTWNSNIIARVRRQIEIFYCRLNYLEVIKRDEKHPFSSCKCWKSNIFLFNRIKSINLFIRTIE